MRGHQRRRLPQNLKGIFNGPGTQCGVYAFGGPESDFDGDGDVDLNDFGLFQACLSAPEQILPNCGRSDLNDSGEVDSDDLNIFLQCMSGEGIPADPNCAD